MTDLEPISLVTDSSGSVRDLRHVDLAEIALAPVEEYGCTMDTYVDGTVVVSANGLSGARTIVGLLVHLDGDRITSWNSTSVTTQNICTM